MQMQSAAGHHHHPQYDSMSPLSADDLEAIRCECFADDVAIPAADDATHWTRDDAIAYFESGGIAMPLPAVIPPTRHIPCVSDIQNAHSGGSYNSGVTQVRLISDHGGSLTGTDGGLIAMSSSWDCRICLWRVNALGGLNPLLCELTHDDPRWVYDVAACGFYGGSLGIISTQTGGMVGEPQHLIRHWSGSKMSSCAACRFGQSSLAHTSPPHSISLASWHKACKTQPTSGARDSKMSMRRPHISNSPMATGSLTRERTPPLLQMPCEATWASCPQPEIRQVRGTRGRGGIVSMC